MYDKSYRITQILVVEGYRAKIEAYLTSSEKKTIFTDDLKTMVHLAENEQDIDTCVNMITR